MTTKTAPTFGPVDLTEMADAGVLYTVNKRVLWPLGLALTWTRHDDGTATDLHIRDWKYEDGHHEAIEDGEDEVAHARRHAFAEYVRRRAQTMPIGDEAFGALALVDEGLLP